MGIKQETYVTASYARENKNQTLKLRSISVFDQFGRYNWKLTIFVKEDKPLTTLIDLLH